MSMNLIRAAILKNRGGLEKATDTELLVIWRSLDIATQDKYLKSLKGEKDADSAGKKSNV